MLEKVKMALGISINSFDTELLDLIEAAKLDLGIAGVELPQELDAIASRAIVSYCAYHFELEHGDGIKAERFKVAYDEQKAQLSMATGYTVW